VNEKSKAKAVAKLTALAARFNGDPKSDRTWQFANCRGCSAFARAAEQLGFQMWASADLAGLLWKGDPMFITSGDERLSCVDGKPIAQKEEI